MPTDLFDCPLYDKCSAPICPLDPKWHRRSHDSSDSICRVLTESAKPGADERFKKKAESDEYAPRKVIWLGIQSECAGVTGEIFAKFPDLRNRVAAAATSGSIFDRGVASGERLRKWREES